MNGWSELVSLGAQVREFSGPTPPPGNKWSPFRAPWNRTVSLLARELRNLSAKNIVIEVGVRESDIRLDGFPRANARMYHPGVILSFESKFGPLRYATCEYTDWQDNVRAIALAMESLRAVDRYGVSKRGEQYQGWKALPRPNDDVGIYDAHDAQVYLDAQWGGDLKRALMETHPDRGGDEVEFRKVIRSKELLGL